MNNALMDSVVGIIEHVEEKSHGVKDGRPWTMFKVVINGDDSFIAFDSGYSLHVGKEGEWRFERRQKGNYVNKVLAPLSKLRAGKELKDPQLEEIINLLKENNRLLNVVLSDLSRRP